MRTGFRNVKCFREEKRMRFWWVNKVHNYVSLGFNSSFFLFFIHYHCLLSHYFCWVNVWFLSLWLTSLSQSLPLHPLLVVIFGYSSFEIFKHSKIHRFFQLFSILMIIIYRKSYSTEESTVVQNSIKLRIVYPN